MRTHWKLLSGLGLAGTMAALLIVGSRDVAGDTDTPAQEPTPPDPAQAPNTVGQDPSVQYELGPGKILFEQQTAEEQTHLERMAETTANDHGPKSHEALARAAEQARGHAEAEIAARQVGMNGTEEQGVVP